MPATDQTPPDEGDIASFIIDTARSATVLAVVTTLEIVGHVANTISRIRKILDHD